MKEKERQMGIDVFMTWPGQSQADREAQGFMTPPTERGGAGYLRESYHGGPYATMVLLPEGWTGDDYAPFQISAAMLRERLPTAVFAALARQEIVYGGNAKPWMATGGLDVLMKTIIENISDRSAFEIAITDEQWRVIEERILRRDLPDYALAFVEFVELAERKEREVGQPVSVYVDH
jgi:hypothetical protein